MAEPASINPRIVESMYCEALVLSDEVRAAFAMSGRIDDASADDDLARVAQSAEGLRTTTRMMHAIAWLLNHRAFFVGELSEFQLRRNGRLSSELYGADEDNLCYLSQDLCDLIAATNRFYARLLRLDRSWRLHEANQTSAIASLRQRVGVRPQVGR